MGMNKGKKWLVGALCVSSLGAISDLAIAVLIWASLAGWNLPTIELEWLSVMLLSSPVCRVIGIILGVLGLRMLVKS
ncbi:MAG: hypothetical protein FJ023_02050 [Chloroflexi bacterium]|nr:hypothetical protein [Chloroflexota bacterium]